jgi:colanic acid/amylovoran biosynthesis protein
MIKVGLLWHSVNSDNLGVVALTVSNIAIVEQVAKECDESVEFEIFGWSDPGPVQILMPNLKIRPMGARDIVDPTRLRRWAKNCDIVLDISAGDSFADIYGAKRFIFNIASKLAVYCSRTPMILSPQTIGPFDRPWAKLAAGAMMKRASVVLARDKLSTDYLAQFKLDNTLEATDVAFRLPYSPAAPRSDAKIHVGINISGLLYNGGYTRNNSFGLKVDYREMSRSLIAGFLADQNNCVHLIGHVNSQSMEVEDDYRVAEELAKEFHGTIVAPRFTTPSEAKSYISGLTFFCGARMHACIAAFSSGVPVIPIAYSRKFLGLFGTLGYNHVADCKTQSSDEIVKLILDCFQRRDLLKQEVAMGRRLAEQKLETYAEVLRKEILKTRAEKSR